VARRDFAEPRASAGKERIGADDESTRAQLSELGKTPSKSPSLLAYRHLMRDGKA
jgi:hypothetical protein